MGGVVCKHPRLREDPPKETLLTKDELFLWEKKVLLYNCRDCKNDVRIIVHVGKITKKEYKHEIIDSKTCDHIEHFTVDVDKAEKVTTKNFGGYILTIFFGPLGGIQYSHHLESIATCKYCGIQFKVRADFWTEKKWWEGQIIEEMHTGQWTPIYDLETQTKTVETKKLSIVSSNNNNN